MMALTQSADITADQLFCENTWWDLEDLKAFLLERAVLCSLNASFDAPCLVCPNMLLNVTCSLLPFVCDPAILVLLCYLLSAVMICFLWSLLASSQSVSRILGRFASSSKILFDKALWVTWVLVNCRPTLDCFWMNMHIVDHSCAYERMRSTMSGLQGAVWHSK